MTANKYPVGTPPNCNHTTRSVGFAHEPHKYKKVV